MSLWLRILHEPLGVPEEASVFKLAEAITQGGWNAPKDATS